MDGLETVIQLSNEMISFDELINVVTKVIRQSYRHSSQRHPSMQQSHIQTHTDKCAGHFLTEQLSRMLM